MDCLLPPACVVCGVGVPAGPPLCAVCASRLTAVPRPGCLKCSAPATSFLSADNCDLCNSWPPGLSAATSAVLHRPPADRLVSGFKYRGWTALAPVMGGLMVDPLRQLVGNQSVTLVPVPLDPVHQRRRGFNQAALLAQELSRLTGMATAEPVGRWSSTRRQANSGRIQRAQNVQGAFYWKSLAHASYGRLTLVDDVLTTGATAAACATVIREAGLECLGIVTFARAMKRPDESWG